MKFCCQDFSFRDEYGVIVFYSGRANVSLINYYPRTREYLIIHSEDVGTGIKYCPYCGKKMPKELWDEWYEVLEKEYGLTEFSAGDHDDERIPPEFLTDEWWKKRGL